jgi:hypothetical protein
MYTVSKIGLWNRLYATCLIFVYLFVCVRVFLIDVLFVCVLSNYDVQEDLREKEIEGWRRKAKDRDQ